MIMALAWPLSDPLDDVLWIDALAADGDLAVLEDKLHALLRLYLRGRRPRARA